MVKIETNISQEIHDALLSVVASCNDMHQATDGSDTHGHLDVNSLVKMVAGDLAKITSDPSSSEAVAMKAILKIHGYR